MASISIPDVALRDNTSQRLPCVLLLDGSGSMGDSGAIDELNAGVRLLETELKKDDIASQRVQLLVIRFGGDGNVEVLSDWTDAMSFNAPQLTAEGLTPMGGAVRLGLQKLEEQKTRYRTNGIAFNRPWMFLITDGEPTDDDWRQAASQCRAAEQADKLIFFGIGVGGGADLSKLGEFSARKPVRLQGLKFRELFLWLSRSTSSASKQAPGSNVQLAPPSDWMQVSA
ncbi:MAG: VWA domain-containing protein [Roseiarcus sp.]